MNQQKPKRDEKARTGKDRPTLSEWLAVKLDIPADLSAHGLRLDMRGRHTLTVHGCGKILHFTPCEVRLAVKDATLTVSGRRLICTSYLAGAVGVEGYICGISFCDGEVTS
jgi:sporulation protein YqfC